MFLNSPKKKPGENPVTRSGSEYKTPPIVSREGGESNRVREEVMEKIRFFIRERHFPVQSVSYFGE
ncbi:hypothetical protein MESMUL_10460 [Mesosutterella multiformis]|jgi:hypothetical protein|uniref:Uncharacterized protein n=1 Tax=Mesosutterella multiformis TaxID=2259133 RepID=A0A388SBJ2_9BURK|nr:hypothetical protein MESMUL_10460 [Mesosutterella multiformis]